MLRLSLILTAALCLAISSAKAAGLTFFQIPAGQDAPFIDAAMWSPCSEKPANMQIQALTVRAVPNCPVAGERLPLVVISHGYGGSYLGHHDTAEALADGGFVVITINHPQANYADMSRANGLGALIRRSIDIRRVIDFMLKVSPHRAKIDPQRIGFYGFSQGGYTGLVLAGAKPDFSRLPPRCADPKAIGCPPANHAPAPLPKQKPPAVTDDPRIRAMVVADPLSIVFQTRESVKDVTIPLQVWASEFGGGSGASPKDVATLAHAFPQIPDFRIAANAVHMSFLTMCPENRLSSAICIDAPGFDRATFHADFNAELVTFFRSNLGD